MRTPAFRWRTTHGPWFDNNLAVVEVTGDGLDFRWLTGEIRDGDLEHPHTRVVSDIRIEGDGESKRLDTWQPLGIRILTRVAHLRR